MIVLALVLGACFADRVHNAYADHAVTLLRELMADATTTEDSLLVRYRLYPLLQDKALLADLPRTTAGMGARELALLSALWAWRIPGSAPWNAVTYGRRAGALLDRARAAAPADPMVRLIDAQSRIFAPGYAGGDVRAAVARLRALHEELPHDACGISLAEVDYWLWFSLVKLRDPAAEAVRDRLMAGDTPRLYREMLRDSAAREATLER